MPVLPLTKKRKLCYLARMALQLALVFHFNQHVGENAQVADRVCYRGLVQTLRAHPQLKFNLHVSGTLLRALAWFDPETLALIRAGVADGQFEILGSTHAQNLPYVCADWDNAQHLALHRALVEHWFGQTPRTFWLAERTWRQTLLPLIAQAGYTTLLIEDHILRSAGLAEPRPARTRHAGHSLTALYDDTALRSRFNYAAWFGRRDQLFAYLQQWADRAGSADFTLAYAEDAEALGLWPWEAGYLPHAAWANLDAILAELARSPLATLVHCRDVPAQVEAASLPDGSAQWMDSALRNPNAPYHEDGYAHWFDFAGRAPKMQYFHRLHNLLRAHLQRVAERRQRPPAWLWQPATPGDAFFNQAVEMFCQHQYEFGCIGVGGRGYWGWENARGLFLYTQAALQADAPRLGRWIEDVNGDGSDEQLLGNGQHWLALTAYGGRVVAGFDLRTAQQWAGNPLAVPTAPYVGGETRWPNLRPPRPAWLPADFSTDLAPFAAWQTAEPAPTRLGKHLPDWIFAGEPATLPVYALPAVAVAPPRLRAHYGLLNDEFMLAGATLFPPDELCDYRFEEDGLTYVIPLRPEVVVEKNVSLQGNAVRARYRLHNATADPLALAWVSRHEINVDYLATLTRGRGCLEYLPSASAPAFRNTHSGLTLTLRPSLTPVSVTCSEELLAVHCTLTMPVMAAPHTVTTFAFDIEITPASG